MTAKQITFGLLRVCLGWIFFWAFIDKLFGLGFATAPEKAWLAGGSPTLGFLKFATKGPLADFYQGMAGNAIVDWLFMMGLLGVGTALLLGIVVRLGSLAGVMMMSLMFTAALPPANNPILDEHIIYALLFITFMFMPVGEWWGLGGWWSRLPFVRRMPWLK